MKDDIRSVEEKVVVLGGVLVVTIPSKMVEQLKLTEESRVKMEMLSDDKLIIEKAEPRALTAADPQFLAAAQRTKEKYAKTLQMLKESDE